MSGASGLIGSALLPALRADGHDVVRLVRREPTGADEIRWDPAAGELDASRLEGTDAIVNLSGENIGQRWTDARQREILESRTTTTGLLARTAAALDPSPVRLRVRIGDRRLRRSWRRDPDRGIGAGIRLRRRRRARLGGGRRSRARGGHSRRPSASGHRPGRRRRRARADAPAVQAGCRRPNRERQAVVQLGRDGGHRRRLPASTRAPT